MGLPGFDHEYFLTQPEEIFWLNRKKIGIFWENFHDLNSHEEGWLVLTWPYQLKDYPGHYSKKTAK